MSDYLAGWLSGAVFGLAAMELAANVATSGWFLDPYTALFGIFVGGIVYPLVARTAIRDNRVRGRGEKS